MFSNLAKVRMKKGKTQSDMAEMLGIAVSTYNMYENGQRRTPENIAIRISNILGCRVEDLFLPATFTVSKTEEAS